MAHKQLTDVLVQRTLPPASGRLEIFDKTLPWLALRITSNGHKSFVIRARVKGTAQPIRYTIGDARLWSLKDARQKARDVLVTMQAGVDPREQKRAQAAAVGRQKRTTFAAVAEAYIAEHVSTLRSAKRTAADIRRYLVKAWGNKPISSITSDDVAET